MRTNIYRHTHSPAEHFGRVGYEYLAAKITDWSGSPDEDAPLADHQADTDRRVLALLLCAAPSTPRGKRAKNAEEKPVVLCGERIGWHRALPELKCWAGQATMLSIVSARVDAIGDAQPNAPLLDWRLPLKTVSGLDAATNTDALDVGFSVASLGMMIETYAARELLAILGMAVSPIVRYGFRCYGYLDPDDQWWQFRVVEREGYHRKYSMSQKVGINGTP